MNTNLSILFALVLGIVGNVTSAPITIPPPSTNTSQASQEMMQTSQLPYPNLKELGSSDTQADGIASPTTNLSSLLPLSDCDRNDELRVDNIEHTFLVWPSYAGKMVLQFEKPFCMPQATAIAVKNILENSSNSTTDAIADRMSEAIVKFKLEVLTTNTFKQIKQLLKSSGLISDDAQDDIQITKSDIINHHWRFNNGSLIAFSEKPFNWTLRYDIAPAMYHAEREHPSSDNKYSIDKNIFSLCDSDSYSIPTEIPQNRTFHTLSSGAKIHVELQFHAPLVACSTATATYAKDAVEDIENILSGSEDAGLEAILTEEGIDRHRRDSEISNFMNDVVFDINRVLLSYGLVNPVEGRNSSRGLEYKATDNGNQCYTYKTVFYHPIGLTLYIHYVRLPK